MSAMEQDLQAAQTVTRVFADNELSWRVRGHLFLITEAALAISLQGRYAVAVDYYGAAHQVRVTVREGEPVGGNRAGFSAQRFFADVALPSSTSTDLERTQAMAALSHIVQTLHHYLEEPAP